MFMCIGEEEKGEKETKIVPMNVVYYMIEKTKIITETHR